MGNESIKKLKLLALELAMNHVNVSSYDLFEKGELADFFEEHLYEDIFDPQNEIIKKQ